MKRLVQNASMALLKLYASVLNTTRIHNHARLEKALLHRPPGVPLITYSNHTSTLDDPVILAALHPSFALRRYALAAEEVIYGGSPLHRWLLNSVGMTIPVRRGEGIGQPAIDTALHLLQAKAAWLHIFVEGKVHPDSNTLFTPIRHGIARLLLECAPIRPWIVPIVHRGMEHLKPFGTHIPKLFKEVDIHVGEIIDGGAVMNKLPPFPEPVSLFALTQFFQIKLEETFTPKP